MTSPISSAITITTVNSPASSTMTITSEGSSDNEDDTIHEGM